LKSQKQKQKQNKMKKISLITSIALIAVTGLAVATGLHAFGMSTINSIMLGLAFSVVSTFINAEARRTAKLSGAAYVLAFNGPTTFTDEVYQDLLTEIIYMNKTVGQGMIRFFDQIKGSGRIRALSATVTGQAYSNAPTASGSTTLQERLITPVKREFYDTIDYETIRNTAGSLEIPDGAANIVQDKFTQAILGLVAGKASRAVETDFWNGATAATQTAVAALTAGTAQNQVSTAEKAYVAAAPTSYVDGVLTKLIYSDATTPGTFAVGARIKVAGTTLSATNIKDEVDKVYAQMDDALLNNPEMSQYATIFMPMNCKKFIRLYNKTAANFRDMFEIEGDNFSYCGVAIQFVPLPSNSMIAGNAMDFVWATDLVADLENVVVDKLPAPAKNFYYDLIFTMENWIFYQSTKVVYVG
jgi:hypothetical protein